MATTFVGMVRWAAGAPTPEDIAEVRKTNQPPAALGEKIRQLPHKLPTTAKLVTSYNINEPDLISVMVVEAESMADIQAINEYYFGWFQITWHPTFVVERD